MNTDKEPLNSEQLIAWMRAEGLIVHPPAEFSTYSTRWRALPEIEKKEVLWELDHLPPGVTASEIIIEGRTTED